MRKMTIAALYVAAKPALTTPHATPLASPACAKRVHSKSGQSELELPNRVTLEGPLLSDASAINMNRTEFFGTITTEQKNVRPRYDFDA